MAKAKKIERLITKAERRDMNPEHCPCRPCTLEEAEGCAACCFVQLCMQSATAAGKLIRLHLIEAEKQLDDLDPYEAAKLRESHGVTDFFQMLEKLTGITFAPLPPNPPNGA